MTSLPIFRLPQLIYIKIINQMNPAEQFLTALCSRKAYALVKKHRSKAIAFTVYTEPYCVSLLYKQERLSKSLVVYIALESIWSSEKEEKSIDINENRGLRCTIDNQNDHDLLEICWKNCSVGLRNMLELVCGLFRIAHVDNVTIRGPEDIWIVDWFKEQQITLEKLHFYDWLHGITDEDIKHVISNCITQRLYMFAKPTDDFQVQIFPNTFGLFFCTFGSWITIDNLIALDCIELLIFGKDFTTQETNRFLKHWINGGSSRLKFFRIAVQKYNHNEIFADIQNHLTRVPEDRVYTSPYYSQFTFNGLQLRRNDGTTASVQYSPAAESIHFGV